MDDARGDGVDPHDAQGLDGHDDGQDDHQDCPGVDEEKTGELRDMMAREFVKFTGEPGDARVSRPVRWGVVGKVLFI